MENVVPEVLQVGHATNWVKVWAGNLVTVALRSDGSLWHWGFNPNPAIWQHGRGPKTNCISTPMRISADTNWVDVGLANWTVLALKSDGTLWAWGIYAHWFTGQSDWQAIALSGGFYQVLSKKDGLLWALRAEPAYVPKPLRLARINLNKTVAAFSGSEGDAPIGVVLTRDGEVWTWGQIFDEYTPARSTLQFLASCARRVHFRAAWGDRAPVVRNTPWQLPILDAEY
jgi:alpha-tubulin suppressor-like RCC1 family protein